MSHYTVIQIRDLKEDGKFTWEQISVLDLYKINYNTIRLSQQLLNEAQEEPMSLEHINDILMGKVDELRIFEETFNNVFQSSSNNNSSIGSNSSSISDNSYRSRSTNRSNNSRRRRRKNRSYGSNQTEKIY